MHGARRTMSMLGVGALAALGAVSAPAASGLPSADLQVTGAFARSAPRAHESLLALEKGSGALRRALPPELGQLAAGGGRVRVVVETQEPAATRTAIARLGGRVERSAPGVVQADVPGASLPALARHASALRVRAPWRRVGHAIAGEQVAATLAAAWHEKGFTGSGVDVAVVDGGFAGLAQRQAEGELPANAVVADFCRGRIDADAHGTAVAEVVHEMAPEARLHLVCIDTEVDLAASIEYLKRAGVRVVNHSMGWFGPSRGDGSGFIGELVASARAAGILWVNSAGNEAQTHWSGTFAGGDRVHDWAPDGDEGNTFVWPDGSEICGLLRWDEWPAARSDYDLALVESETNQVIVVSDGYQTGSQPPVEGLCSDQETGRDLVVYWAILAYDAVAAPRLDLFSYSPPLQYQTAAGSIVDPATSSAALAVGALCWQSRQLEPYSSQGPTIDGRVKPDLVGHDSVSGATYGTFTGCPSAFAGTSASSPEVAGAAALVKQAYPAYGPRELQAYLVRHARDLGTVGPDGATGAGELRLPEPSDVIAPSAKALPASGRAGRLVRLTARVSDDSGELLVVVQVKRGGRVLATYRRGFLPALQPTTVAVTWKAPARLEGRYQHCVTASDRAGNASPASCARVIVG